jgi:hypothetical protein
MMEFVLVAAGVVLGVLVKTFVDPVLERRKRRGQRHDDWLEEGMKHADGVLAHIAVARSDAIAEGQLLDPDALALTIVRSLDVKFSPQPLLDAASQDTRGKDLLVLV